MNTQYKGRISDRSLSKDNLLYYSRKKRIQQSLLFPSASRRRVLRRFNTECQSRHVQCSFSNTKAYCRSVPENELNSKKNFPDEKLRQSKKIRKIEDFPTFRELLVHDFQIAALHSSNVVVERRQFLQALSLKRVVILSSPKMMCLGMDC